MADLTGRLAELYRRYEDIAAVGDHTGTASDYKLRDLEIAYATQWVGPNDSLLDVGCGYGFALSKYAKITNGSLVGIDYSPTMVEKGKEFLQEFNLEKRVDLVHASVLELPFPDESFDVITSHRCLMALLSWDRQKDALAELARVLKPTGTLVLMEGTFEGLDRLNQLRVEAGLTVIPADGADRLMTLKFHEEDLLAFCETIFHLEEHRGFGTYYFLGRVVHPLLVAPDPPSYGHPVNEVARVLGEKFPNLVDCGHLQAFALKKKVL